MSQYYSPHSIWITFPPKFAMGYQIFHFYIWFETFFLSFQIVNQQMYFFMFINAHL